MTGPEHILFQLLLAVLATFRDLGMFKGVSARVWEASILNGIGISRYTTATAKSPEISPQFSYTRWTVL
jgi:hypothetical protein